MIRLTRLNGSEFYLNPSMIEIIEESPDTHLTLSNGNRYLVLESVKIINERIMCLQSRVLRRVASAPTLKYLQRRNEENFRPVCNLNRV